jgi:hypothetical protein
MNFESFSNLFESSAASELFAAVKNCEYPKSFSNNEEFDVLFIETGSDSIQSICTELINLPSHFKNVKYHFPGKLKSTNPKELIDFVNFLSEMGVISIILADDKSLGLEILQYFRETKSNIKVLTNNPENIVSEPCEYIDFLAYQRHNLSISYLSLIEELSPGSASLGILKNTFSAMEPLLRNAELLYVAMDVVKKSDAPNSKTSQPTGVTAEEFCQLARFSSNSSEIKCLLIDTSELTQSEEARIENVLIAEMLWYVLEGLQHRVLESPAIHHDAFEQYIINTKEFDLDLTFAVSDKTGLWWVGFEDKARILRWFPCTFEDYQQCTKGNITERLFRRLSM